MHRPEPRDAAQLGIDLDAPPSPPGTAAEPSGRPARTRSGRPRLRRASESGTEAARALAADQARTLQRLEPLALIVGSMKGYFRLDHVRDLAEKAGVLTGQEGHPDPGTGRLAEPRALAFLGYLLPGLAALGLIERATSHGAPLYQRSERPGAGGNLQTVWKLTPAGSMTGPYNGSIEDLTRRIAEIRESVISSVAADRVDP